MSEREKGERIAADVKCYFCGHISGQIIGQRGKPLRLSSFVPRPGYTGTPPKRGAQVRCERCGGPTYLEDATPLAAVKAKLEKTMGETPILAKRGPKAA
jgi:hypothetical protein